MEFLVLNLLASLRTDDVTIVVEVSEDLKTESASEAVLSSSCHEV